jgi:phosphosulfolactate synthase (CoM biosynthesis protein A)
LGRGLRQPAAGHRGLEGGDDPQGPGGVRPEGPRGGRQEEGLENPIPLLDNARICLEAGARLILLEAAELLAGDSATSAAVEDIVAAAGLEKVMFELPGPWIGGVTASDVHRFRCELIDRYGTEVNIGNVAADDLMSLEAYRRGLGVNAGS